MAKWGTFKWGDSTKWGHAVADYPHRVPLTIKIAGVDRTNSIDPISILIEEVVTKRDSRASFVVTNGGAMSLTELDSVTIAGWEQEHEFAGYIWKLEELTRGVQLDYRIDCTDYAWDLKHPEALVDEKYTSKSDQYIIQDLMATSCPGIEVSTYVEEVNPNIYLSMSFNNETPFAVIERLAEDAGAEWHVDFGPVAGDPTKWAYLHYFDSGTDAAPYTLSDTPDFSTSFPYKNVSKFTETPLANKVIVAGKHWYGTRFLSTELDSKQGTAVAGYDYLSDDGQDFTEWQTVGGNAQYLVMAKCGTANINWPIWAYLGQATSAARIAVNRVIGLTAGDPAYWNGRRAYTTVVSYSIFRANSDYGRWIIAKLVDVDITEPSQVSSVGDQFLTEAAASVSYRLDAHEPGLRAGQDVTFVNAIRGVNDSFMIMSLSKRFDRGGLAAYTVQLGKYIPSLAAIIVRDSDAGGLTGTIVGDAIKVELGVFEEALFYVDEGDPFLGFNIAGIDLFTLGVDDSDYDKFKISLDDILGVDDIFTIDLDGVVTLGLNDILTIDDVGAVTLGVGDVFQIDSVGDIDIFSDVSLKEQKELRFYDDGNYVGFEAPTLAADQIWALPTADGASGQYLKTDGAGALGWSTAVGTGDIVGPASSTDHAIARWDGTTGKLLQDCRLIVSDVGFITTTTAFNVVCDGDFDITANDGVSIYANTEDMTLWCGDAFFIYSVNAIDISSIYGKVELTAGTNVYLSGTAIYISGDLDITGSTTLAGTTASSFEIQGSSDPILIFDIGGTDKFTVGVDDSDSDKFKINSGSSLADASNFELDSGGNVTILGSFTAATLIGANVTSGADPGHTHTGASLSGVDISADTNLAVTAPIVLTDDTLSHSAANGYVHIPASGSSAQVLQYSSAGTAKWITLSSDVTIADGGAMTVADDSHNHIYSNIDATTSANWIGRVSDETGTGAWVFANTPTLVTPEIGAATGTSVDFGGTTLLASRALTVDTGGVFNIVLASAAGDDFTVDTDKLVVEGDTGNVGIGTAVPETLLEIYEASALTGGTGPLNLLTISGNDNGDAQSGDGVGILFKIPSDGTKQVGASIHAVRTSGADVNSSTCLTFSVSGDDETLDETMRVDYRGRVGIATINPLGVCHIDQIGTTLAIPTLVLDQADLSEEFVKFIATIGAGNPIEAVGGKTLTTTHFIRVEIPGPAYVYIPVGTIA